MNGSNDRILERELEIDGIVSYNSKTHPNWYTQGRKWNCGKFYPVPKSGSQNLGPKIRSQNPVPKSGPVYPVPKIDSRDLYLDYLPAIREILRSDPNLKNRPNKQTSSRRSRAHAPYHQNIIDLEHDEIEKLQSAFS